MRFDNKSLLVFAGLVVAACSASPDSAPIGNSGGSGGAGGGDTQTGGNGQGGSGGDGGGFIPGTGGGGGGSADDCSVAAKLVYVLSDANDLYSFDPPAKLFTKIGQMGCNAGAMLPNSMAVDRTATAWVNYVGSDFLGTDTSGAIFKVSTKDASCAPAPTVTLIPNWYRIGMGFSTNGPGQMGETLYVTGTTGSGLGKIDSTTNMLNVIGGFSPGAFSGQSAELTGTGDGRLYGYFTTSPVQMGQINKDNGSVSNPVTITGLQTPNAWAFSFWGGSFYLYAASGLSNSTVTKYDPATGVIDNSYMQDVGFRIVGAGVSTCAPIEPPK